MKPFVFFINIVLFVLFSNSVFADGGVYTFKSSDMFYIQEQSYKKDQTISEIISRTDWKSYSKNKLSLTIQSKPIWLKMHGAKLFSEEIFFSLKNPLIDFVAIYVVQDEKVIDRFSFGDHNSESIYNGQFYHNTKVDPLLDTTFYVYINSSGIMYIPFEISDEFDFFEYSFKNNIILGLFLGALSFFVLYSLIMVLIARKYLHLLYSLFALGMLLLYSYQEGFAVNYFANENGYHDYLYPLITALVILVCSIFNVNYTQIKKYNFKIYLLMILPISLSIFSLILLPFIDINTSTYMNLVNFVLITIVSIIGGIYLCLRGKIEGIFLTLSLIFFVPGSSLYVFAVLGIIEVDFPAKYFIQTGHALELLVWAIAMGFKVYSMRKTIINQRHDLHYNSLTNVLNRKGVNYEINKILHDEHINGFSLAILDIDHFKNINDSFGHNVGDQALQFFAEFFKHRIRDHDIFGRWGGEEFILILPETDKDTANTIISRILNDLNNTPYITDDFNISMTFSAGIACSNRGISKDFDFTALMEEADDKLYLAKDTGRNKVCS